MEEDIFDIEFSDNGQLYKGWVNPSDKLGKDGQPVSFHVVLNNVSFGYLSFHNCVWTINEDRPAGLVQKAGEEIEKHFAL
ncbi:MAG: hypothetical protein WDO19_14285 [Bacteroidota bacterium]